MNSIAHTDVNETPNIQATDDITGESLATLRPNSSHSRQFAERARNTSPNESKPCCDHAENPFDTTNIRNEESNPGEISAEGVSFDMVSDDAAGTIFTIANEDGSEFSAEINENNRLIIDGQAYSEVDDDTLSFSINNGQLSVLHDGKALAGYTPMDVGTNASLTTGLQDTQGNAQHGRFVLNGDTIEAGNPEEQNELSSYAEVQNSIAAAPGTEVISPNNTSQKSSFQGDATFKDYLSTLMGGDAFGLEQQKFQYGGYDSSDVRTLTEWDDVLATGTVRENQDGSITLSSSAQTPRVQFYPDDDAPGGRSPTKVSELQDVEFGLSIDGWSEGEAAWIYELHNVGDGQAMAVGFNQEGKLMLANGETTETDISLVDAAGVSIDYNNGAANVSILNQDGSVRGTESIQINADEVHVKGIELYNRRAAADTELSATFNQIRFGNNTA